MIACFLVRILWPGWAFVCDCMFFGWGLMAWMSAWTKEPSSGIAGDLKVMNSKIVTGKTKEMSSIAGFC